MNPLLGIGLSIGVVGTVGSLATGIYDCCKIVGSIFRTPREIPDSYVTYSHGRDPFTG